MKGGALRRLLIATALNLAVTTPGWAFDFTRQTFASLVNARAASMNVPLRLFLLRCDPTSDPPAEICVFQAATGLMLDIDTPRGATTSDFAGIVWDGKPASQDAFAQAVVILMTLCSPNATDPQRRETVLKLMAPIEQNGAAAGEVFGAIDDVAYVAAKKDGVGWMLKAIDSSAATAK